MITNFGECSDVGPRVEKWSLGFQTNKKTKQEWSLHGILMASHRYVDHEQYTIKKTAEPAITIYLINPLHGLIKFSLHPLHL
jgi:hypothetical protein